MDATQKITKNLGGNRLGSGDKNNISLHAYNRSTHDLSRAWRSSMNVGTLIPCFKEPALNGDTWSIDIRELVRTVPAVGPLYGSYKLQIDFFSCPIRLYNGLLHNNMINIGMNMAQVKLPKFSIQHKMLNPRLYDYDVKLSQIATDSLVKYMGVSGLGDVTFVNEAYVNIQRKFNAVPILAYWDIYKNYYANKQEDRGYYIRPKAIQTGGELTNLNSWINTTEMNEETRFQNMTFKDANSADIPAGMTLSGDTFQRINPNGEYPGDTFTYAYYVMDKPQLFSRQNLQVVIHWQDGQPGDEDYNTGYNKYSLQDLFPDAEWEEDKIKLGYPDLNEIFPHERIRWHGIGYDYTQNNSTEIEIRAFNLKNIDDARIAILKGTGLNNEISINEDIDWEPFIAVTEADTNGFSKNSYSQNGIGIKTHQSDLLNNWLKTEWIDGDNGINQITAIDVSSGTFTIDALNLANKVYNMLNRIAVSGGTYEDWQEAVYSTEATRRAETPIYCGGLSAEVVFEEVISTAQTEKDPLGTLAGKGTMTNTKGGHVEIRVDEPSYIIGIASITPRIDYSEGNDWDMLELDTIDDLHKPALDGIGFEDLLEERAAWWGTYWDTITEKWVKIAAGKVPAWINYMTSINKCFGDFADYKKCMYMTLNRRYEIRDFSLGSRPGIKDMTTYINPTKYNYSFADTNLNAQNFWVQLGFGVECRRVMSAKQIPNL